MYSKYDNYSKFNNQHDWEDSSDHLMTRIIIFISIMNNIFIWAPKSMRKVAMVSIWICTPSHNNHVFHILQEVG